ncbi:hypothetical protein RI129_002415 [Pyrocoelia pectoralis]|uniref:Uncharacterized protein n=1 Tax=Pyrocoelia pectoralis TaxID=417401 RepID=A0AAN7VMP5_9COLE
MRTVSLSFYLFLFYGIYAQDDIQFEYLGESEKTCIKELNIDEFTIDYNFNQLYLPESNVEFSRFIECVWKKKGLMSDKNNLQYDSLQEYIATKFLDVIGNTKNANAFAKDSVNGCKVVRGETPGKTAITFMNCVTRLFHN